MSATLKTADKPAMKLAYATKESAPLVPGRRAFFQYRDLGVTNGSNGAMRAQLTSVIRGLTEPTGWHYHTCEGQFVYVLKGWVDLEFEGGESIHLAASESIFIPGHLRHNELRTSDDLELLEVSMPAQMGTVACERPEGLASTR
jgi:quercetin dioxygenase-like cupin family protein